MTDFEGWRDQVGPGWRPIVEELHAKLLELKPNYELLQIKEKFGGLRYYVANETAQMATLIDDAEKRAGETCEDCGAPGELRGGRWLRTLCDTCHEAFQARRRADVAAVQPWAYPYEGDGAA